jgi:hypothetical protein
MLLFVCLDSDVLPHVVCLQAVLHFVPSTHQTNTIFNAVVCLSWLQIYYYFKQHQVAACSCLLVRNVFINAACSYLAASL